MKIEKERIVVDFNNIRSIKENLNKMLFCRGTNRFYVITTFEYEEKEEEKIIKSFFFTERKEKKNINLVTEMTIKSYSDEGLFWGHYDSEEAIRRVLYDIEDRIRQMRDDFKRKIVLPLEAVGVIFPKKDTESK
jgi:hypothetical protein